MAERSCWRLAGILNNLLDLSRIESGRMELKLEKFPIQGHIEFTLSSLKLHAGERSIDLSMLAADPLPPVYADREMVEQILTNLIGNAIKFTPEGGKIIVVAEPLDGNENMVAISVKDSGIGIPEDQRENVFKKFYQVENSLRRSAGGTGLGLAITKGLVEVLQGKIWVESEVGKGSTFTFTLPTEKGERRDAYFRLTMDREFKQAENLHGPLTLFLIEVPASNNETKEALMAQLEERVKKCLCRKADLLLKREKEKLLTAFCTTDRKGAQVILRRMKEEIAGFIRSSGDPPPVVNIGVATYPEEVQCKRELFRLAKKRLKEEKNDLKNDTDRR
jgi:GGDEF domain-containing protein